MVRELKMIGENRTNLLDMISYEFLEKIKFYDVEIGRGKVVYSAPRKILEHVEELKNIKVLKMRAQTFS